MTPTPFNQSSYLTQVRRLRALAAEALKHYRIQVKAINFIHHGENTTFRVDAKDRQKYLLRVHRSDYHTKEAIEEEMSWLPLLSQRGLSVPTPVISKRGELVETVAHPGIQMPQRNCSLFKWIDGRFIRKSVKPSHLFQIGQIVGDLQTNTPRARVKHRRYWTAAGLVGETPKFGSIDTLADVRPKQQEIIRTARRLVLKKLRQFEQKFPERQGLIHADLHFGNILNVGKTLGAIDFDDCGLGFHAYDLVIPMFSVANTLGESGVDRLPEFKDALIAGYSTKRVWDKYDDEIFPYLWTARRLLMLGWLNSRSDNPRLRKHLKGSVERTLKHLKNDYDFR